MFNLRLVSPSFDSNLTDDLFRYIKGNVYTGIELGIPTQCVAAGVSVSPQIVVPKAQQMRIGVAKPTPYSGVGQARSVSYNVNNDLFVEGLVIN